MSRGKVVPPSTGCCRHRFRSVDRLGAGQLLQQAPRPCNALAASTSMELRSSTSPPVWLLLLQVLFKLAVLTRAERSRRRCKSLGSSNNAAVCSPYTWPHEPSSVGRGPQMSTAVGRVSGLGRLVSRISCTALRVRSPESRGHPSHVSRLFGYRSLLRVGSQRRRRSASAAEREAS